MKRTAAQNLAKWRYRRSEKGIAKEKLYKQSQACKESNRLYRQRHKVRLSKQANLYQKKRRWADPCFRLLLNLRCRYHHALVGTYKKYGKSLEMLGCSTEYWRHWLSNQFMPGMCWENYGSYWEIDHIISISKFDLSTPQGQSQALHYTNTQPLLISLNRSKGGRY